MGISLRSVLIFGAAVVLAGCSTIPASIAESEWPGGLPTEAVTANPESLNQDPSFPTPVSVAGWLEDGAKFAVVLSGSSSCPAYPSSIEVVSPQHIKLDVGIRGAQACTADMAPRTYIIKTPTDVNVNNEVTLEYGDVKVALPPPVKTTK